MERHPDGSVTLSRLRLDQLDDVHAIQSDPRTWTHSPGQRSDDPDTTRSTIARSDRSWDAHGFGLWSVQQDGVVVGVAGATLLDLGVWSLYYRFRPEAGGRGLARWAAGRAVAESRLRAPERPVVARILANNQRSARVAGEVGLSLRWRGPVGLDADRLIYATHDLDDDVLAGLVALG